jgi:hypothetical protein
MASAATITGIFLIVAMIGIGAGQVLLEHWPGSGLAGAVVAAPPTQQDINRCMDNCMEHCVGRLEDQKPCLEICTPQCGA